MEDIEILEDRINYNEDDSLNLIAINKQLEEFLDYLEKSIIIENEDAKDESK